MRKVTSNYENPVDNVLLDIVDRNVDWFYNKGFNPNGITFLSALFGLLSIYGAGTQHYILSALAIVISYYFDCMDGYMARKYNLVSRAGDYFDHVKDIIVFILLFIVVGYKYSTFENCNAKLILIGMMLFGILTAMNYGCQEVMNEDVKYDEKIDSLTFMKSFCPATDRTTAESAIQFTKWGGSGSFIILTACVIGAMEYYDK